MGISAVFAREQRMTTPKILEFYGFMDGPLPFSTILLISPKATFLNCPSESLLSNFLRFIEVFLQ